VRVAGAVHTFVVVQHHVQHLAVAAALPFQQQLVATLGVAAHDGEFGSVSRPGLFSTSSGIRALPMSCSRPARPATRQAASSMPSWRASEIISAHTATECM
jgi:hypothetical protein